MRFGVGWKAIRIASAVVVVALGAGACGSDQPMAAAALPPEPVIDLSTLDVGNHPAKPREYGVVKTIEQAKIIEAERLANFLPLTSEIDPRFQFGHKLTSRVFFDPRHSDLSDAIKLDKFAEVAPDFVTGFASGGTTDLNVQGIDLMNVVMVFPDEQKAAEMAVALELSDRGYNDQNVPVEIPKYPAAKAHWVPTTQSIGSWFATGKLVIYSWVYDYLRIHAEVVDQNELLTLVQKSLDAVVPAVAKFTPTPADQLMNLQLDIDGMLGRTLPRINEEFNTNPPGVYTGLAGLHFSTTPGAARPNWEAAGVDRYAQDQARVYRARDRAAALRLFEQHTELSKKVRTAAAPKNLPQAKCWEYVGKDKLAIRFYCAVSYDRYTALVPSQQLLDAQQRISAQYALLVTAK
ncbi:hypothetical protein [Nocardia sp. XZ_19_385]|uniref:DUF7373 family lipoprotein n=1 Tax=Nocardia sp. XZ_19_385 TaxID=2769488 RepID=UPI00188DEEEF|nr:hypothetical protein [Nocardia sp. XZ_19_385]